MWLGPACCLVSTCASQSWKTEISVLREGIEQECASLLSCAAHRGGYMDRQTECTAPKAAEILLPLQILVLLFKSLHCHTGQ